MIFNSSLYIQFYIAENNRKISLCTGIDKTIEALQQQILKPAEDKLIHYRSSGTGCPDVRYEGQSWNMHAHTECIYMEHACTHRVYIHGTCMHTQSVYTWNMHAHTECIIYIHFKLW